MTNKFWTGNIENMFDARKTYFPWFSTLILFPIKIKSAPNIHFNWIRLTSSRDLNGSLRTHRIIDYALLPELLFFSVLFDWEGALFSSGWCVCVYAMKIFELKIAWKAWEWKWLMVQNYIVCWMDGWMIKDDVFVYLQNIFLFVMGGIMFWVKINDAVVTNRKACWNIWFLLIRSTAKTTCSCFFI